MSEDAGPLPPYQGNDMASYMLKMGFELPDRPYYGTILSLTNVRDTAIIVTEGAILRAKPASYTGVGFCVEILVAF
jgi:hypothetical protein